MGKQIVLLQEVESLLGKSSQQASLSYEKIEKLYEKALGTELEKPFSEKPFKKIPLTLEDSFSFPDIYSNFLETYKENEHYHWNCKIEYLEDYLRKLAYEGIKKIKGCNCPIETTRLMLRFQLTFEDMGKEPYFCEEIRDAAKTIAKLSEPYFRGTVTLYAHGGSKTIGGRGRSRRIPKGWKKTRNQNLKRYEDKLFKKFPPIPPTPS